MATILSARSASTQVDLSLSPLARSADPLAIAAATLSAGTQLVMLARMALVDLAAPHAREILFADPVYLNRP